MRNGKTRKSIKIIALTTFIMLAIQYLSLTAQGASFKINAYKFYRYNKPCIRIDFIGMKTSPKYSIGYKLSTQKNYTKWAEVKVKAGQKHIGVLPAEWGKTYNIIVEAMDAYSKRNASASANVTIPAKKK